MYGAETSKFYNAQHIARGKDYRGEAETVAAEIRRHRPHAASVLDVACGTGGHLPAFSELIGHTEGVDVSAPMLEVARADMPDLPLHLGDMRNFDLGRTFDAVTCLFGSIGYVSSRAELDQALACLARHVEPHGVVAVEPWWFPETYIDHWVSGDIVEHEGTTIARVTRTVRDGDASRMEAHYLAASSEAGVRHLTEVHRAMLFPRRIYEAAFRAAGLEPDYVPEVQSGRGLFVAVRTADAPPAEL